MAGEDKMMYFLTFKRIEKRKKVEVMMVKKRACANTVKIQSV